MERNKGRSLFEKKSDYTIIDLETTGFDPRFNEIIELGAIRVRDNKVVETYQQLVKPENPIDKFITELTGITNEMLENAPGIEHTLPEFISFISNDIVVGHNVNFDINFVYDNYFKLYGKEFRNDYIDTLRIARTTLKELEHHRLSDLKDYYKIKATAHRSISDCVATYEVYNKLWADLETKGIRHITHKVTYSYYIKASDIHAETEPDESSPIYGKTIVFTGTLERMSRKDAMQIVANNGGINGDNVTKKTNLLVLGNGDYSCILKDGKSSKHKKAEQLISQGADLQIISEDVFFDMLEL
ncbi:MAG: DNA polymerase III PolC-type [Firmicutes bacterium ADurb.Bin419]|jgi:DNA polymerase-3 subunit epsilon|nr:MAG: DNA polymerase III PolC-type [Firmicutes bacterium ADurb.Bin419]